MHSATPRYALGAAIVFPIIVMNSWGNEQFAMQNMMHPNIMPNMMPPGAMAPPLMPPLMMHGTMVPEMNQMQLQPMVTQHVNPPQPTGQFIGPVIPEDVSTQFETTPENGQDQTQEKDNGNDQTKDKRQSRDRNDRRDRERERGKFISFISRRKYLYFDFYLPLVLLYQHNLCS